MVVAGHASWSSWAMVEGLVAACGVELEVSDESAGDEDVAGEAGDDDGGLLVVVFGSDGDCVGFVDVADTIVDGDSVDAGGGPDGTVSWPGFWGDGVDAGGCFAAYGPVGSLVVVDVAEYVELGLELVEGGCLWLGG